MDGNYCIWCGADPEEYHDKGCPNDDPEDKKSEQRSEVSK